MSNSPTSTLQRPTLIRFAKRESQYPDHCNFFRIMHADNDDDACSFVCEQYRPAFAPSRHGRNTNKTIFWRIVLPSFLNLHSFWCLFIDLEGPRYSQPAPANWQATSVPEQWYRRWSSRFPRCRTSLQESECGHVTGCLSRSLQENTDLNAKLIKATLLRS